MSSTADSQVTPSERLHYKGVEEEESRVDFKSVFTSFADRAMRANAEVTFEK